jgi:hypothetical protein
MLRYVVYLIEEHHVHGNKTDLTCAVESKKAILLKAMHRKTNKIDAGTIPLPWVTASSTHWVRNFDPLANVYAFVVAVLRCTWVSTD